MTDSCERKSPVIGKCQVCGTETLKVVWREAIVKIYICSEPCLQKYFAPLGSVKVIKRLDKPGEEESWLD